MYKYKDDERIMYNGLKIYFVIYLVLIFTLTIFNRGLLSSKPIFYEFNSLRDALQSSNIIPFKETFILIKNSLNNGIYENLSLLLGNVLVLIPLAYFLPRLFKKQNNFMTFTFTVIIFAFFIELTQLITLTGVFDIDDIIFNSLGAIIFFKPFNKSFFKKGLDKLILLSDDKLKKNDVVKIAISLVLIISLFVVVAYYYYVNDSAVEIEIVDESTTCVGEKELIYENDDYKYYLPCQKSDYIYVIFEKKHKFLVKDLINGNVQSKYVKRFNPDIYLNYDDIFIKEVKGIQLELEIEENVNVYSDYDSDTIVLKSALISYSVDGKKIQTFIIKPISVGVTDVLFKQVDVYDNSKVIKTDVYEIIVKDDLSVVYLKK